MWTKDPDPDDPKRPDPVPQYKYFLFYFYFRHFIQRWNTVKREKMKQDRKYPILVPKVTKEYRIKNVHFKMRKLDVPIPWE